MKAIKTRATVKQPAIKSWRANRQAKEIRRLRELSVERLGKLHQSQSAYEMQKGLLIHVRDRTRGLESRLENILSLLPDNSLLNEPRQLKFDELKTRRRSVSVVTNQPFNMGVMPSEFERIESMVQRLDMLSVDFSSNIYRAQVHATVRLGDGEPMCYAISEHALAVTPKDALIKHLSQQVAPDLVRGLLTIRRG